MADLSRFFKARIAAELGILPEQVTPDFLEEMRYRMYRDHQFQTDPRQPTQRRTSGEIILWNFKLRFWAHDILVNNVKLCH